MINVVSKRLLCFFFTTQGLSDDRRNSFPQSFPRSMTHFSKDKSVSKSSIWKKSLHFNSSINKENSAFIWCSLIQWLAISGQPYANGKLNLPDPKSNVYGWETMIKLLLISLSQKFEKVKFNGSSERSCSNADSNSQVWFKTQTSTFIGYKNSSMVMGLKTMHWEECLNFCFYISKMN